jgi:hypothetical protein
VPKGYGVMDISNLLKRYVNLALQVNGVPHVYTSKNIQDGNDIEVGDWELEIKKIGDEYISVLRVITAENIEWHSSAIESPHNAT